MKRSILAFAVSASVVLAAGPSYAVQRGHGGGPKGSPTGGATHGPATHPHGGDAGTKAHGPQAKPTGKSHTPGSTGSASSSKTTTKSTTRLTTTTTLSPVQQKLQRNTNLADKLRGRLPAGTDPMIASAGFRNLGQFVAAVNVSSNLGIPFAELKTRMVDDRMSLGQAIKDARPTSDYRSEARRAERDAAVIIKSSEATTSGRTKPAVKRKPQPDRTGAE